MGKREDYIPVIREFYAKLTFNCAISRFERGNTYGGVEELAVEGQYDSLKRGSGLSYFDIIESLFFIQKPLFFFLFQIVYIESSYKRSSVINLLTFPVINLEISLSDKLK